MNVGEGPATQGTHPNTAPTCLAVDSSEACRALADKGPGEVPAGASVSAGLRLALICLCRDRGTCLSLQRQDRRLQVPTRLHIGGTQALHSPT